MVSNETLLEVVSRLEAAIERLQSGKQTDPNRSFEIEPEEAKPYTDYWNNSSTALLQMLEHSRKTKYPAELEELTNIAIEAKCLKRDILELCSKYKKPEKEGVKALQTELLNISKKTAAISAKNKEVSLHAELVKSGIDALFWVTVDQHCPEIAKQYVDMIDIPANKIFLKKVPEESAWVRSFKDAMKEVVTLVAKDYRTGVDWNFGGEEFEKMLPNLGQFYKTFSETKTLTPPVKRRVVSPNKKLTPMNSTQLETQVYTNFVIDLKRLLGELQADAHATGIKNLGELTQLVTESFNYFIRVLQNYRKYKPPTPENLAKLGEFLIARSKKAAELKSDKEVSLFVECVQNGLNCIFWITKELRCAEITKIYMEMVDSPGNKILMMKKPELTKWLNTFKAILKSMDALVRENYKTGFDWNFQGSANFEEFLAAVSQEQKSSVKKLVVSGNGLVEFGEDLAVSEVLSVSAPGGDWIIGLPSSLLHARIENASSGELRVVSPSAVVYCVNSNGLTISAVEGVKLVLEDSKVKVKVGEKVFES